MRGQLRYVIDRAYSELWEPIPASFDTPTGFFGEVFAGLAPFLRPPTPSYVQDEDGDVRDTTETIEAKIARAQSSDADAQKMLLLLNFDSFGSELQTTRALSSTSTVLDDLDLALAKEQYVQILREFVERYSLRYYVDDSAAFWPTLPGIATALFEEIRFVADTDSHLRSRLGEFERSVADCTLDPHEGNIKTALQKQVILLEAIGHSCNSSNLGETLGAMCVAVETWPHDELKRAAMSMNKFVNNYPGIRHGGTPANARRPLDSRDLVAVMLGFLGMTPYFADNLRQGAGLELDGDRHQMASGTSATAPWPTAVAQ
jgi:hypothetical protein